MIKHANQLMNLKLIKPDYKSHKQKAYLDYSQFEECVRKVGNQILFKGGFGNATKSTINLNRNYNQFQKIEHQFQIQAIIKRYQHTILKKKEEDHQNEKSRNKLFAKSQSDIELLRKSMIKHNKKKTDSYYNTRLNLGKSTHNNSYSLSLSQKVQSNRIKSNSLNTRNKHNSMFSSMRASNAFKLKGEFKDPFIHTEKKTYQFDKMVLCDLLRKQNRFYFKNDNDFENVKFKIFKRCKLAMKFNEKHSLQNIHKMLRKSSKE